MRLFVAIALPEDVVARLEDLQDRIPAGRLVPPENLHLTISFLGEVEERDTEALHEALSEIDAVPFDLSLAGLGTFGSRSPNVLWIGVRLCEPLDRLHRKVRGAIHAAGLMTERERFRPHVTLARFGSGLTPDEERRMASFMAVWGATEIAPFVVDGMSLIQSRLGKDAARYEELAVYPFERRDGTA